MEAPPSPASACAPASAPAPATPALPPVPPRGPRPARSLSPHANAAHPSTASHEAQDKLFIEPHSLEARQRHDPTGPLRHQDRERSMKAARVSTRTEPAADIAVLRSGAEIPSLRAVL